MSRTLARARSLLARPGAWIDGGEGDYRLRLSSDRRLRPALRLDETVFRALVAAPGLRTLPGGGWAARRTTTAGARAAAPAPGRPGFLEGERTVVEPDGRLTVRRANRGDTALAWLARRRDGAGRPWLSPAQVAAGERLGRDAEIALSGPSLTLRWDALPRAGGGSAARAEPGDRALAAGRRVEAALSACGLHRPVLDAVCVRGGTLGMLERELGLGRRRGKTALIQALATLAAYYGIG